MNYQLKKGYKLTEVGVIPEDWKVFNLGDLIDYTKGFPFKSSEYQRTGIRVIRVSDTTYDSIREEAPIFVSEISAAKYTNWKLTEHDLVVSTVGSKPPMYDSMVGKVVLISKAHENTLLNQNAVLMRQKKYGVHTQWLLLNHLRTRKYLTHIEAIYRGNANQASITLKELFHFQIPLPNNEIEQRSIATALSDMDALLVGIDRLIAKKRDLKQAAMQQLLTGKTRLPGFSGDWEVKRLGDLAEILMGQSPSSSNYNHHGAGIPLIQGNADIKHRKTIKRIFTTQLTKQGKSGDILMSVRAPVGEISRTEFDVCLGRGVCAIRFDNDFMYHCLIYLEPRTNLDKAFKGVNIRFS